MHWHWDWVTVVCGIGSGVGLLWAIAKYRGEVGVANLGLAMVDRAHPVTGVRPEVVAMVNSSVRAKGLRLGLGRLAWLLALLLAGLTQRVWFACVLPLVLGAGGSLLIVLA